MKLKVRTSLNQQKLQKNRTEFRKEMKSYVPLQDENMVKIIVANV